MMRCLLLIFVGIFPFYLFAQRNCNSEDYRKQLTASDPLLAQKLKAVESFTAEAVQNRQPRLTAAGTIQNGMNVITIPVVVHILYNQASYNISDEQIQSQLAVLNEDYRKINKDAQSIPEAFAKYSADCFIEFKLANVDPNGNSTNGIIRKKTSIQFFGLDDRIKSSAIGGDDAWDPDQYLNIWVGHLAGILGYSSPLGGPSSKDGVVIESSAFGTVGIVSAPYNKGRTATHEVGHWLGLQHIWGDTYCGNDHVDDTPPQQSATFGCPSVSAITCGNSGNMFMNFMDLTNDACLSMFTTGQRERMRAAFLSGGARHALLYSKALSGTSTGTSSPVPQEELTTRKLQIFPNPAAHELSIDFGTEKEAAGKRITIYNINGQRVLQSVISGENLRINVSSLKEGMYFLSIEGRSKAIRFFKRN
jgi:hypothetical protein